MLPDLSSQAGRESFKAMDAPFGHGRTRSTNSGRDLDLEFWIARLDRLAGGRPPLETSLGQQRSGETYGVRVDAALLLIGHGEEPRAGHQRRARWRSATSSQITNFKVTAGSCPVTLPVILVAITVASRPNGRTAFLLSHFAVYRDGYALFIFQNNFIQSQDYPS